MALFERFLGIRPRSPGAVAPSGPATTPRGVARQLADSVVETAADPAELETLLAIARLWRTPEAALPDEVMAVDVYAAEFALDHVLMTGSLRTELRKEFRAALEKQGVDVKSVLARQSAYLTRLREDKETALREGMVHSIADSIGAVFVQTLGGENALLADAVGRRFLDHTEALREYVESALRVIGRG